MYLFMKYEFFRIKRIARKNAVVNDKFRSPRTDLLLGCDPWVWITENKIKYNFDITKSMFCRGNITEKLRIAKEMIVVKCNYTFILIKFGAGR